MTFREAGDEQTHHARKNTILRQHRQNTIHLFHIPSVLFRSLLSHQQSSSLADCPTRRYNLARPTILLLASTCSQSIRPWPDPWHHRPRASGHFQGASFEDAKSKTASAAQGQQQQRKECGHANIALISNRASYATVCIRILSMLTDA